MSEKICSVYRIIYTMLQIVFLQFGNGISKREDMRKRPEEGILLTNHCHINQDTAVFLSLSLSLSLLLGQYLVSGTTGNYSGGELVK